MTDQELAVDEENIRLDATEAVLQGFEERALVLVVVVSVGVRQGDDGWRELFFVGRRSRSEDNRQGECGDDKMMSGVTQWHDALPCRSEWYGGNKPLGMIWGRRRKA